MTCLRQLGRRASAAASAILLASLPVHVPAQTPPAADGDQLLARAVDAPGLNSYSVPVQFLVRLHTIIGIRTRAQGTVYYRAPAEAALHITSASGIIGGLFKGAYKLDIVPQGWPATYQVVAVKPSQPGSAPVLVLQALPRIANAANADITQVLFTLTSPGLVPVSAEWHYKDGSTISLTLVNHRVGDYMLPSQATIAVNRRYRLDADATYGAYAINIPVPDSVFTSAK
jgi:hypothetical protein